MNACKRGRHAARAANANGGLHKFKQGFSFFFFFFHYFLAISIYCGVYLIYVFKYLGCFFFLAFHGFMWVYLNL